MSAAELVGNAAEREGDLHCGFCYSCNHEVMANIGEDLELRCLVCGLSCVELLVDVGEGLQRPAEPQAAASEAAVALSSDPPLGAHGTSTAEVSTMPLPPAPVNPPPPPPPQIRARFSPHAATRPAANMPAAPPPPTLPPPPAHAPRPPHVPRSQQRHYGVICDGCQARDFAGARFRCLSCNDFDLCSACYLRREAIHPHHRFEAIQTPRSLLQTLMGASELSDMAARVVTVVEFSFDEWAGEDQDSRTGFNDQQVAWWLADERRLADMNRVTDQDPPWTCSICSEGIEAESTHGWVVRICNDRAEKLAPGQTGEERDTEPEGHIYHEACLRRWLLRKNACPVCRASPVIPPDALSGAA
eukprot:TRINITY_DN1149_c0_g2_i1.p1 TRINITY_DN1149_c0_g2~~TRINITY_DN1149_c0_g2_i1.p1  ORF type:complete len:359 (-),score=50.30 TRINITY_DN1149_c0_g2_i1:43-1119(-)